MEMLLNGVLIPRDDFFSKRLESKEMEMCKHKFLLFQKQLMVEETRRIKIENTIRRSIISECMKKINKFN
jgi:hypothetical protein